MMRDYNRAKANEEIAFAHDQKENAHAQIAFAHEER